MSDRPEMTTLDEAEGASKIIGATKITERRIGPGEGDGEVDAPVLQLRKVSVALGTGAAARPITHEVSFSVKRSRTVALVGESGSGKSVTAMSIAGLLPSELSSRGEVTFGGRDLLRTTPDQLRTARGREIGVVFQEPMTALNPVYTIGTLLRQAITSHGTERASRREIRTRSLELLTTVGLPEPQRRLHQYPHQLSGGQRQRAMIAMAIAQHPRLLIADEPTTALDVTAQAEILTLLADLRERLGMSLLLITHDMGVVARMADDVVVMNEGRVVEHRDVVGLFTDPQQSYTRELLAAVPFLGRSRQRAQGRRCSPDQPGPSGDEHDHEHLGTKARLDVRDLVVDFPAGFRRTARAVDQVSFSVASDEFVGLVGESGSGKSTIARVAVGLLRPTSGTVRVDDIDVGGLPRHRRDGPDVRRLRRSAAMIFQDPASSLNPRASIADSIRGPLRWTKSESDPAAMSGRVAELLEQVRLPASWADRYPHELSGGQRQRVGIARALAVRPSLLIADEPTSALDVSVQASILDLLLELRSELGFSCLFISHDLSVVETLADRIVVLRAGAVVEQGATARVLFDPQQEYTRELVAAVPVPDLSERRDRQVG